MNRPAYIFYALVMLPLGFVVNELDFNTNYLLVFIHAIIAFISIKIITRKNSGMLNQAAGVFFLIFFAIFPIHELANNIIYWDGENFSSEIRLLGSFSVLIFVFLFWTALKITFPSYKKDLPFFHRLFKIHAISERRNKWLFFCIIIGISLIFNLYEFKFFTLFVKGGKFSSELNFDLKATYLLVEFFLRPLVFNACLVAFLLFSKNIFHKIFFIVAMIFVASPTGVSRFLFAALYMPLLMVMIMKRHNKNETVLSYNFYLLPNLLLFGLFSAFPFLEIFRYFSFEKFVNFSFSENLSAGSFDAFQMFLRALDVGSVSYGYGCLGVFLFFVPRSVWPSKPVTSGFEISELSGLRHDNVSMPIIGEFYLNFWYFGVIFGALLLAMLFKKIDCYCLRYKNSNLSLGHLAYFQLACLVIYNMRGGLLSSFAYTIGIMISWVIIAFVIDPKYTHKI